MSESKHLLLDSGACDDGGAIPRLRQRKKSVTTVILAAYGILTTLIILFQVARGVHFAPKFCEGRQDAPRSIIHESLPLETQPVQVHPGSLFSGPPSDEHDAAWAGLLEPLFVNVSTSELRDLNIDLYSDPKEPLQLLDGGYIASLEVYHHLHCIVSLLIFVSRVPMAHKPSQRRLKWHLYESYYFSNMTDSAREKEHGHMNHCIESLRLTTMCHAETSLYTLRWQGKDTKPEAKTNATRTCRKWSAVDEWARPRAVVNSPMLVDPGKMEALRAIKVAPGGQR